MRNVAVLVVVLVVVVLLLNGCGVDGAPERPGAPAAGLSLSGHAVVGVKTGL
jgi:hypothetical protein